MIAATPISKSPPNCCRTCGDGTEPGHELCSAHEREAEVDKLPRRPQGGTYYVRGVRGSGRSRIAMRGRR